MFLSDYILHISIALISIVLYKFLKPWIYPSSIPGPVPWPIIGNALQMDMERPYVTMLTWAKKYGNVFLINLAGQDTIVVTGYKEMKEFLVDKGSDFADRIESYRIKIVSFDYSNTAHMMYNEKFKYIRKLLFNGLKQHDLKNIEEITQDILTDFVSDVKALNGEAFVPNDYIFDVFIQILHVMAFSNKIDKEHPEVKLLKEFDKLFAEGMSFAGPAVLLDTFPFLRFFGNKTYKKFERMRTITKELYLPWKEAALRGELESSSWFMKLVNKLDDPEPILNDDNVMTLVIHDLFFGALANSSTSMITMLNVLVNYPDVQRKMQEEIDRVVGRERSVSLKDRENLPYIRACIQELLRYFTGGHLGIPHQATCNTSLGGHPVPKSTIIILNLWAHHHDPSIWPDPFTFKPERFLKDDGSLVHSWESPADQLFIFGGGPRGCPGETLALTRLFLFIGTIVQKFRILPGTCMEEQTGIRPDKDFDLGVVLLPKKYTIRMEERN